MMVKKSAMREHEKNECKGRLQKCDYCKKDVKLNLMKVGLISSEPFERVICQQVLGAQFPHG